MRFLGDRKWESLLMPASSKKSITLLRFFLAGFTGWVYPVAAIAGAGSNARRLAG
ncbi:hypothetical protein OU5_P0241 (plasmid) [Pseudomonas mandelii JR-1]|uniref:Uncharacterized protein n=1 Tax=Pseudomonas mandelii JR-1 TaxID=1147786 RepID=A0A024EM71_9PSED|nr:hypothetical protein OU5_P0241 [Pseudomonas mandelii JR-1]